MKKNNTYNFEAETGRLLELLTHSIYSNKEIFLRELLSNASDAIDKARIKSLTDTNYLWENTHFEIKVWIEEEWKIITIEDNGIGMSKDEILKNIWTIAKSGTKDFLEKLKDSKEQNNLIGQFGVWFYSVFMVADKVELSTKSAEDEQWYLWISEGKWSFELKESDKKDRGTVIKIFLKSGEEEFGNDWKLRELIKKHSNYVGIPIMMLERENEENKDKQKSWEQVNETKALWNKSKQEITSEEYDAFYSSISYDYSKPLAHIHQNTEWMVSYKSILFIPKEKNMFGGWDDPSKEYGPKLYVQNVLILDHAKDLLPVWLRFISGVVQTSDLPLNISREMLQANTSLDKIKKWLTKKVLDTLKKELENNKEHYDVFLQNYGKILKEWIYYDHELKENIAWVVKFHSLLQNKDITLDEYLDNIPSKDEKDAKEEKTSKKEIYFITAKSIAEAKANPYIDQFKQKNIDVLLLTDPIDEWIVQALTSYKSHPLKSITDTTLDITSEDEKKEIEDIAKDSKDLLELIKNTLWSDKIEKVQISKRLWDNLAALSTPTGWLTPQMEKMMKAMGQNIPAQKRILDISPDHKIFQKLKWLFEKDLKSQELKDIILYTYEQAIMLEWWELEDYKWFISRVNKFIEK